MRHLFWLVLSSVLVAQSLSAQTPVIAAPDPLVSVDQMKQDLAFLREKILAQHSHPFLYTSSEEFDRLYDEEKAALTKPLGRREFYLHAARLAASLKDGHTLVDPLIEDFQGYAKTHGVFPLEVTFVGDRLYVKKNASGDPALVAGNEITAINGQPISAIVAADRQLINDVHPIYDVYARLFREMYWLAFGDTSSFVIESRSPKGTRRTSRVPGHIFAADEFHSYAAATQPIRLAVLPNRKIALLTIDSFSPTPTYDQDVDRAFADLQRSGAQALIIDVRRNGGGSGRLAQEVVSYLTTEPYRQIGAFYVKVTDDLKHLYEQGTTHTDADTKAIVMANPSGSLVDGLKESGPLIITPPHRDHVFHGPVYLLTANNTFSAAAMFAAYVKCNRLGTVVGTEPGQTTNFVADAVPFEMPNSGLSFHVSFSEIHMPCDQSYYHGIQPDVLSSETADSVGHEKDIVMDTAVKLALSHLR